MKTRLFTPDLVAQYLRRLNRFVMECQHPESGEVLAVHVGNPGRMWELLEPGSKLALERLGPGGKMEWRAGAVEYKGAWVPLMSARANQAAADLVLALIFPGAKLRAEVRVGKKRLDFSATYVDEKGNSSPIYRGKIV